LGIPLMYWSLIIRHASTLRNKEKLLIEAANEFPNVGHVLFLVEACTVTHNLICSMKSK
jgi:hypothetical protein